LNPETSFNYRNDISRKSSNVKLKHQQLLLFNIASQASDLIKKLIKHKLDHLI